jgi:hypothetical protein
MKRLRRYFLAFALALAFALGQHAAALHALGHAAMRSPRTIRCPRPRSARTTRSSPPSVPRSAPKPPVAPFVAAVCQVASTPVLASASLAPRFTFLSRAPPTLS